MHLPLRHLLGWLVSMLVALATPLQAAESLRFFTQPLFIPERGTVTSCVILLGTNRFSFLPPPEWRVQCDANSKEVTLTSRDLGVAMRFKFVSDRLQSSQPLHTESLRQQVFQRFLGGKIINEFACFTSGRAGLAFDVEYIAAKKIRMLTRLAFIPFPVAWWSSI